MTKSTSLKQIFTASLIKVFTKSIKTQTIGHACPEKLRSAVSLASIQSDKSLSCISYLVSAQQRL